MNRLVTWRYEFAIIATWVLDRIVAWPHLWPSTASDYVETVLTRASESTVFGLKSTKKSTKVVKKRWRICSGRGSRRFESCHLDHKEKHPMRVLFFMLDGGFSNLLKVSSRAASLALIKRNFTFRRRRNNGSESCHLDQKRTHSLAGWVLFVEMMWWEPCQQTAAVFSNFCKRKKRVTKKSLPKIAQYVCKYFCFVLLVFLPFYLRSSFFYAILTK